MSRPWPSGEYGTKPMPSSRSTGRIPASTSRVQSEYSVCSALTGWTAWARRIVSGPTSDKSEVQDFALGDQFRDCRGGLLDRRVPVYAVL
jgi:hypothetical protein